jgi:hypothetical protein
MAFSGATCGVNPRPGRELFRRRERRKRTVPIKCARKSWRAEIFSKITFLSMAIGVFALFEFFHIGREADFLIIFDLKTRFFLLEVAAHESVPLKRLP